MLSKLSYGIQEASVVEMAPEDFKATVGHHIRTMLRDTDEPHLSAQIRQALADPQSTIEIKSGEQVQTATPDMPLRELLSPGGEQMEITVNQPHVGG